MSMFRKFMESIWRNPIPFMDMEVDDIVANNVDIVGHSTLNCCPSTLKNELRLARIHNDIIPQAVEYAAMMCLLKPFDQENELTILNSMIEFMENNGIEFSQEGKAFYPSWPNVEDILLMMIGGISKGQDLREELIGTVQKYFG